MIYRTAPYSATLNDPYPCFQRHRYLMLNISATVPDTDIVSMVTNMDLHTTYSAASFRMSFSDLAKFSMTRSVARSLCDGWAYCL